MTRISPTIFLTIDLFHTRDPATLTTMSSGDAPLVPLFVKPCEFVRERELPIGVDVDIVFLTLCWAGLSFFRFLVTCLDPIFFFFLYIEKNLSKPLFLVLSDHDEFIKN